jgi:hypothetical protein
MSTVAPPPQVPPPQASAPPPPTAVIDTPPAALARLAVGAKLDALVLANLGGGKVQASVGGATVILETPFRAAQGAVLGLQIQARGAVLRVAIVTVDGQAAQTAARPGAPGQAGAAGQPAASGAPPAAGAAAAATPAASAPVVTLTAGSTVTARLLTPAAAPSAPAAATTPPQASAPPSAAAPAVGGLAATLGRLGGQARALLGSAGGPPQTPGAPAAPGAAAAGRSAPSSATGPQGSGGVAALPAGSAVRVTVVSVTPPAGAPPAPQAPQPGAQPIIVGQTLSGTVTGTAPGGQAVVQTPAGALALPGAPPPAGTQVTLQIAAAPQPPPSDPALDPAHLARAQVRAATWPSMADAVATLERADPALAQQVTTAVLPNLSTGTGLAAGILMFLGALKGGDARAAFGDAALRALDKARPGSGARLDGDLKAMARAGDDAQAAGDWRAAVIPAVAGHEIHPIRLLLRRGGDGDEEGDGDGSGDSPGTRFVIDAAFDRLGRVQLDGAVPEGGKRLDLIVRTEHRLPGVMQRDIRSIVADAAALSGLGGGLTFQADPSGFVEIADDGDDGDAPGPIVGLDI